MLEGGGAGSKGESYLATLNISRARTATPEHGIAWPRKNLATFADEWGTFTRETGRLDFADLLEVALWDLEVASGWPKAIFLF